MPEHSENVAENILNNIMETFSDSVPKQKSVRFFEDENTVSARMNRLFGRQKSLHVIFGGGKSADVLLWRNKKISSSVLAGATAVWVLFEWLNYHFLTLVCLALVVGMLIQFVWSNASGLVNRTPSRVPRVVLPDELFANIGMAIGTEINRFLGFLQDVSSGRNLKQFLMDNITGAMFVVRNHSGQFLVAGSICSMLELWRKLKPRTWEGLKAAPLVVAGLWAAAIIGSWCNFLTVLYIGFVSAHTLPVLYERYEDQVDDLVNSVLGQVQQHYRKLDEGVLSKIPKGNLRAKKSE
ncbi:hypothetical protein Taro_053868 [Colocasia esculenta]|uniref:Reticulon-like protein n=1 Tax=Colocasia esculenta TaxID=4460 RepID=A0A843XP12_COLES|nr:hypothetical protein [Colocasia esculenta]